MIGVLLAVLCSLADPADALDPVARSFYLEAQRLERTGSFESAATHYRKVRELDPFFDQATLDLGRTLEVLGEYEAAEAVYLEDPFDVDCTLALGELYLGLERWQEALQTFDRLLPLSGNQPEVIRLQVLALAGIDAVEAEKRFRDYLRYEHVVDPASEVVSQTALRVASSLEDSGEEDLAFQVLEDLQSRVEGDEAAAYAELLDALTVRRQARIRARIGAEPLTSAQRSILERSRKLARRDPESAHLVVRSLVEEAPRSAEAHAALAGAAEQVGRIDEAVVHARQATLLAPLDADYLIRYGDLLADHFGGRYDVAAIDAYTRAVSRKRDSSTLWARKARVEQRAGRYEAAVRSLERVVGLAEDPDQREQAEAELAELRRELPELPELEPAHLPEVTPGASEPFYVALEYFERNEEGDLERARTHLDEALSVAPDYVEALNLQGDLAARSGDGEGAAEAYRKSLAVQENQPRILASLAAIERSLGNRQAAEQLIQRAAQLGAADALFYEARAAAERGEWFRARTLLDDYMTAPSSSLTRDRAVALRGRVQQRILALQLGGSGLGLALLAVPLLAVAWRRTGASLDKLLTRSPSASRDVARICAGIRHEVLKHNTTVLPAVADAVEGGDPEPARWLGTRLFADGGPIARFWGYVEDLEILARAHGARLNLRYRDPVFGPLIAGVQRLQRLRRDLRAGSGRRLADELRQLSRVLNDQAYGALGDLVTRACVLRLTRPLVADVWARVRQEPAFMDAPPIDFHLEMPDGVPLYLRIYRTELEDILTNLLRNSLQASLEAGTDRIGVRVTTEEDWVTGLERVRIAVRDDAPRRISTSMIRGRYIERGLGLAVDLISRGGGSIGVEGAEGWSKQVVVALPRAELEAT